MLMHSTRGNGTTYVLCTTSPCAIAVLSDLKIKVTLKTGTDIHFNNFKHIYSSIVSMKIFKFQNFILFQQTLISIVAQALN